MSEPQDPPTEMAPTEFTFRVGMALGRAMAPQPALSLPRLEPGQRVFQVWSEPSWMGYRTLLTFELVEK